jgi:hypothetical protein
VQVSELQKGLSEHAATLQNVDDNVVQMHQVSEDTLASVRQGLTQLQGLQGSTVTMQQSLQESVDLQGFLLEGSRTLAGRLGELQGQHEQQARLAAEAWQVSALKRAGEWLCLPALQLCCANQLHQHIARCHPIV